MKRIIFLLLLCSAAFPAGCISDASDIIMSEQGTLIAAAIGLMVVVIAAAYMIGSATSNANYTLFAKDEIYHLGFSIMMLLVFSGIVLLCCDIMDYFMATTFSYVGTSGSTCYVSGTSTIQTASECYVNRMTNTARALGERYVQKHIDALMESTFSFSIQFPLMDYYITVPSSYKRIVSNQYDMMMNSFILPAMVSISMQKLAVNFINENIIRWVLPIGFLLRIPPPTRQMGDILIALALALYVIVPVMYTFNLAMYDITLNDCNSSNYNAACDYAVDGGACSQYACTNPDGFWRVALLIPQAIFLPNLTIAILVTFMASIHKALRVIG